MKSQFSENFTCVDSYFWSRINVILSELAYIKPWFNFFKRNCNFYQIDMLCVYLLKVILLINIKH